MIGMKCEVGSSRIPFDGREPDQLAGSWTGIVDREQHGSKASRENAPRMVRPGESRVECCVRNPHNVYVKRLRLLEASGLLQSDCHLTRRP